MADKQAEMRRLPDIIDPVFWDIYPKVASCSLCSTEKLYNFYCATRYVVEQGIPGDIIECGVWFGGSVMLAGETLAYLGDRRKVFLYDTFRGFTERSENDITLTGEKEGVHRFPSIRNAVEENLAKTCFDNYVIVEGDVLETLSADSHSEISIFRIDTDTYATTLHELKTGYDKIVPGGILIIDDYGHCMGSRMATDEYFSSIAKRPFFQRPNWSSRTAVKY